jgi:hypothetical protein
MARLNQGDFTIHGEKADSINEYNVAKALDKLKLDYHYQFYFGMALVRGSQVIDFLVHSHPKPTPLFVHGEYWHKGQYAAEQDLKQSEINSRMRGTWAEVQIIWENECETEEDALQKVKSIFG